VAPIDRTRIHHRANHAVSGLTRVFGSLTAIGLAVVVVVMWTLGLAYDAGSERLITSLTTVVTFVMVFIIQSTQNRESRAMQTKLDALLIANDRLSEGALLGLEQMPDATIKDVQAEVHSTGDVDDGRTGSPPDPGPRPSVQSAAPGANSSRTRAVSSGGTPRTSTS